MPLNTHVRRGPRRAAAPQINLHWLQRWVERLSGQKGEAAAAVAESVATMLLLEDNSEACACQLLDYMGYEAAEDVSLLMENRWGGPRGRG